MSEPPEILEPTDPGLARPSIKPGDLLNELRAALTNLVKYGRSGRLYGGWHDQTEHFLGLFCEGLSRCAATGADLVLEVEAQALFWKGQRVLGGEKGAIELVHGLYSEGARALWLGQQITTEELRELASILTVQWESPGGVDQDLETAIWQADFETVHLDIADHFAFEEDGGGQGAIRQDLAQGKGAGTGAGKGLGDSILVPEIQGLLGELAADALQAQDVIRLKQDELALLLSLREDIGEDADPLGGDEELIELDAGVQRALEQEVESVVRGGDAGFERIGQLLFELLRLEKESAVVSDIARVIARHCFQLLNQGELEGVACLVRWIMDLVEEKELAFPHGAQIQTAFRSLVQESERPRFAELLSRHVQSERQCGQVFTLLMLLPRDAVSELVDLGAQVQNSLVRQVIADVVLLKVEKDAEAIETLLATSAPDQAVVPLLAIGRLPGKIAVEECLRRSRSDKPPVREAALRALRAQRSPQVRELMLRSLQDPVSEVRLEALRYLSVYRDRNSLAALEKGLKSRLVSQCSDKERRAWFIAYGLVGRLDAIAFLRGVALGQVPLPGLAQGVQVDALEALGGLGLEESRAAFDLVLRKAPELGRSLESRREGRN